MPPTKFWMKLGTKLALLFLVLFFVSSYIWPIAIAGTMFLVVKKRFCKKLSKVQGEVKNLAMKKEKCYEFKAL